MLWRISCAYRKTATCNEYNQSELNEMIGVLDHDSALYGYTGPWATWANEMDFVVNHAPGAWSIAWSIDR